MAPIYFVENLKTVILYMAFTYLVPQRKDNCLFS